MRHWCAQTQFLSFFVFLDTVSFGTGLVLQSDVNSFKGGGST